MAKRFRAEDLKPIALTGKYAGKETKANEIDHKDCKAWKLYCPKCYQFVHLRKSDKIKSYFAHYDVEDKNCKYRVESSSNNAAANINTNENQGQDLEGIQKDFEAIFSSIDSSYEKITNTINNIPYLKYISNEIKNKFIKFDANQNIKEEWEELEDWIRNNSSNNHDHCIAVLNILSIDMNRYILEKLIQYAINYVVLESFELSSSLATASTIKAKIQPNKEDFSNKTIEKILQLIIDIDWREGKQFKTNSNYKNRKYKPYVSNFNRGDGSSSLSINESYSIISCENSIYSVIDKRQNKSELFKLELNYEKGINCEFLRLTSPSQDFFSQLIWKIINSSNVHWFMLAVGILASQKIEVDILTVNFIDPPSPLPLSDEKWIDSTNQVIRLIEEEIEKIPGNSNPTNLGSLQAMLAVAEQELQELGINSKFLIDKLKKNKLEDKCNSVAQDKLRASTKKNNRNQVHFPEIPLFARKERKDIIVTIKPSPIKEDILAYIEWCDLSIITSGKSAIWHPYGSLKRKKVKDVAVLYFHVPDKVPNKYYNYAANYKLQDGKHTAIHYVAMALTQWGLRDNDYVVNPIKPQYQDQQITPRPLYHKELCKYLELHLAPKEIDGHVYIRLVKDNRGCKVINDFKRKNPQLKHIAHNPEVRKVSVAVRSSALGKVRSSGVGEVNTTEHTASSSKEISQSEFDRLLATEIKYNHRLSSLKNSSEPIEIVLRDKRILKRVPKLESVYQFKYEDVVVNLGTGKHVIMKKKIGSEIGKRQVGFKYYIVTERRIDTWHP